MERIAREDMRKALRMSDNSKPAGQYCWAHGLTANGLVDWATCVKIFTT
jgi:hypothetical protein